MLKRIIFDLDNTLITWKDDYNISYSQALDELGISHSEKDIIELDRIVDTFDKNYDYYKKQDMVDYINSNWYIKVPNNFVDVWMKYLCDCVCDDDKEVIPTLEYLSKKYELVILSNWFSYSQNERLKKVGIYNYFKELYYTEDIKNKPNKEGFIKACGPYDPSECIMIGDNYSVDIVGANNAGLKAILIDKNNKYDYKDKIKNINELEELL